ncbi:MAG: type IV pilin protein [Thiohalobacterales bacterium]|nr:type IV pilin protein [Thiohalobacterales bacterium]
MKQMRKGFSLIELLVVITVVALLATLAYPSYANFIRKAQRAQAQATMIDWANRLEVWRADNPTYSTDINPTNTDRYEYSITADATSYTLTATAIGQQVDDKEDGVSCGSMTLLQDGSVGPPGYQRCWGG